MKKLLSILLILSMLLSIVSCSNKNNNENSDTDNTDTGTNNDSSTENDGAPVIELPEINGTEISNFKIVYDKEGLDYNARAAEYIKSEIQKKFSISLTVADDSEPQSEHEIVVGETSRAISSALEAETEGLEFSILAKDGSVALEGDYFIIAAAAYYFVYNLTAATDGKYTVSEEVEIHDPIVKEAKNYIILIGDGMGVNQTLLFDQMEDTTDFSDKENFFYGYLLPSQGYSMTNSLSGVTDSAAGGTALSSGIKTVNGYVGQNKNSEDVLNLTELCASLGMATAVMSTESQTGATPSSFSAHVNNRQLDDEIEADQEALEDKYGTIIKCNYNYYTARYMNSSVEKRVTDVLSQLEADDDGFFLMYEEAHIDKHSHNNDMEMTFQAVLRFNQVIARFMEHAFYNPDTFIIITADHETGDLRANDDGIFEYNSDAHSGANVPIFAYGDGSAIFNGKTIENVQIPQTIASFLGIYDFGDQDNYGYLK